MDAIEPEALEMLQSYAWPGNVRELENVMQRAIILAPGRAVRAEDLNLSNHEQDEDAGAFDEVVNIADYQPAGSFRAPAPRLQDQAGRRPRCAKPTATRPWLPAAFPSHAPICIACCAWPKPTLRPFSPSSPSVTPLPPEKDNWISDENVAPVS
jgi:hypothetical protein